MKEYNFIVPLKIVQERKTKKDRNVWLTMNWYRNVHYILNNKMKVEFKESIKDQLEGICFATPIEVEYRLFYRSMSDLDNRQAVITKYFQDALVECECIEDDNFDYIKKNTYIVIEKDFKNPRMEVTIKPYANTY